MITKTTDESKSIVILLKVLVISMLLSVLLCLAVDPVWGFYESFMALMASGSINGNLITENYHMGMSPMLKLLALLHYYFPSYPWTAIVILLCWGIIQTLALYLVFKQSWLQKFTGIKIAAIWVLMVLVVWGISFIDLSITGAGMLLTCLSFLAFWRVYHRVQGRVIRYGAYLILSLCIFTGYSWRIESGLGGTLIALIFIITTELRFFYLLKVFWFPAVIIAAFFIRFYFVMNSHPFFENVEPLVFYVTDSHNSPPISTTDSTEVLIRQMVRSSILIDTSTFNYDLFKKIADEKLAYEQNMLNNRPKGIFRQIVGEAGPTLANNKSVLTIYGIIIIALFLAFIRQPKSKIFVQMVVFNGAMWGIICFLAYSLKMEQWHFMPIMQLTLFGNILLALPLIRTGLFKKRRALSLVALCCISILSILNLYNEIKANRIKMDGKIAIANDIFKNQNNRLVFFDSSTREVLDDYAFRLFKRRNGVYFYDMAQLPFLPEYEKHLNDLCNCNSHSAKEFFEFLKINTGNVVYYSTPQRVEMLQNYLKKIHLVSMSFHSTGPSSVLLNKYGETRITPYRLVFN